MSLPVKTIVLTIVGQGGVDGHHFKYSSCSTSNKMSFFKYSSCSTSNKMSLPIRANFKNFSSFKFRVEGCWFGVLILFYL